MKIAVYAIAKNEAAFAKRFCEAAKDADQIVVADTGSTDATVNLLRACGAIVHPITISPWRFDDARNACLALLDADVDVCISLDLDEVLQPGWREEVERLWAEGVTRLRYKFDWGKGIVFFAEKIHARRGYRWSRPCHEYIRPDRITEVWANTDKLLVVHKPDDNKSRGQYLDLLKVAVAEDAHDPQTAFYYARELSFYGLWQEAAQECERYLALPLASWPHERCYAMRVLAQAYAHLGDLPVALGWLRRATEEAPDTREPWCDLADHCQRHGDFVSSFAAALQALAVTERQHLYTCDAANWGARPHDLASRAAFGLGLHLDALNHAKDALALAPTDRRLRNNIVAIERTIAAENLRGLGSGEVARPLQSPAPQHGPQSRPSPVAKLGHAIRNESTRERGAWSLRPHADAAAN